MACSRECCFITKELFNGCLHQQVCGGDEGLSQDLMVYLASRDPAKLLEEAKTEGNQGFTLKHSHD